MKPKPRSEADPIERQIERGIHPGAFIRDGECFSFVSDLEEVAAAIDQMIPTDPARGRAIRDIPGWVPREGG